VEDAEGAPDDGQIRITLEPHEHIPWAYFLLQHCTCFFSTAATTSNSGIGSNSVQIPRTSSENLGDGSNRSSRYNNRGWIQTQSASINGFGEVTANQDDTYYTNNGNTQQQQSSDSSSSAARFGIQRHELGPNGCCGATTFDWTVKLRMALTAEVDQQQSKQNRSPEKSSTSQVGACLSVRVKSFDDTKHHLIERRRQQQQQQQKTGNVADIVMQLGNSIGAGDTGGADAVIEQPLELGPCGLLTTDKSNQEIKSNNGGGGSGPIINQLVKHQERVLEKNGMTHQGSVLWFHVDTSAEMRLTPSSAHSKDDITNEDTFANASIRNTDTRIIVKATTGSGSGRVKQEFMLI